MSHKRDRGRGEVMERLTLRIPEQQRNGLTQLVDSGRYPSMSEAAREALRIFLAAQQDRRRASHDDRRKHLRSDGGRASIERFVRDEVRSHEREQTAQCPHTRPGELPCVGCFLRGESDG